MVVVVVRARPGVETCPDGIGAHRSRCCCCWQRTFRGGFDASGAGSAVVDGAWPQLQPSPPPSLPSHADCDCCY